MQEVAWSMRDSGQEQMDDLVSVADMSKFG